MMSHTVLRQALSAGMALLLSLGAAAQHASHGGKPPRPQLAGSAAFAPDGRLWFVGLDAQGRLFVRTAPAGAPQHLGEPRLLATDGDAISADGENRPKLAFGPNGLAVISYTRPLARPYTGWVRLLRSTDGGETFAPPVTVHADRQEITHRFESIAFDAQGVLHTVWIDKRDLEAAPRVGKKSSYRGAAIYRNESRDGGQTFGPDIKVADHSCECCRIALARSADGRLHALWRHVFDPNERDHALAALVPGAEVVRATFDGWRVDACPHHGPGLSAARDGGWHAVWFGIRQQAGLERAAVRYARLDAAGRPVPGSERELPDETAEHADVLAQGPRVAVVWRGFAQGHNVLRAWFSNDGGQSFTERELARHAGDNDHPRLVGDGQRMVVVWRNAQEVQVHALDF